jgi:uncharacterized protein involved in outer membrane biogenesis
VGNIKAHMLYEKSVVLLDPLQVAYLGGQIGASVKIDTTPGTPKVSASGKIRKLPIGRLLRELAVPSIVSGSLTTTFNISGVGKSLYSVVRSMTGTVTTSLWGGSIGTNLINLTGLNLVTWLSSKSQKGSVKLVCAVMPFNFKNGRASSSSLVIETDKVQIVGRGWMDFRRDAVQLNFQPAPKVKQVVEIVTPFSVNGKLSNPSISVKHRAGRAAAEVLTMPLNLLGLLAGGGAKKKTKHRPCIVQRKKVSNKARKNKKFIKYGR